MEKIRLCEEELSCREQYLKRKYGEALSQEEMRGIKRRVTGLVNAMDIIYLDKRRQT